MHSKGGPPPPPPLPLWPGWGGGGRSRKKRRGMCKESGILLYITSTRRVYLRKKWWRRRTRKKGCINTGHWRLRINYIGHTRTLCRLWCMWPSNILTHNATKKYRLEYSCRSKSRRWFANTLHTSKPLLKSTFIPKYCVFYIDSMWKKIRQRKGQPWPKKGRSWGQEANDDDDQRDAHFAQPLAHMTFQCFNTPCKRKAKAGLKEARV